MNIQRLSFPADDGHVSLSVKDAQALADAVAALHKSSGGSKTWKQAELERFAQSRGWKVYQRDWMLNQLQAGRMIAPNCEDEDMRVLDHRECFILNRKPSAILAHTYAPWEDCVAFAHQNRLLVERLPYSWYSPGCATAALFTRSATSELNPKGFTVWLRAQSKRMDPVGDLSRDYIDDCRIKKQRYSTEALRSALVLHGCLDAQLTFNDAMAEYQAQAVRS